MNRINTIIIGLALVFAAYLISNIQRKTKEFDRSVQVKGLAEREVPADIAVWPVQITVVGNDLKALEANLEEQKSVVQGFFSSMGFDADEMRSGMTILLNPPFLTCRLTWNPMTPTYPKCLRKNRPRKNSKNWLIIRSTPFVPLKSQVSRKCSPLLIHKLSRRSLQCSKCSTRSLRASTI